MPFSTFREKVNAIAKTANSRVHFASESGKHIARFSDGVIITGNTTCPSVTVRWGDRHLAVAQI